MAILLNTAIAWSGNIENDDKSEAVKQAIGEAENTTDLEALETDVNAEVVTTVETGLKEKS